MRNFILKYGYDKFNNYAKLSKEKISEYFFTFANFTWFADFKACSSALWAKSTSFHAFFTRLFLIALSFRKFPSCASTFITSRECSESALLSHLFLKFI